MLMMCVASLEVACIAFFLHVKWIVHKKAHAVCHNYLCFVLIGATTMSGLSKTEQTLLCCVALMPWVSAHAGIHSFLSFLTSWLGNTLNRKSCSHNETAGPRCTGWVMHWCRWMKERVQLPLQPKGTEREACTYF